VKAILTTIFSSVAAFAVGAAMVLVLVGAGNSGLAQHGPSGHPAEQTPSSLCSRLAPQPQFVAHLVRTAADGHECRPTSVQV
jgi:hypothetical protein